MDLTNKLKNIENKYGLDIFGVANVSGFLNKEYIGGRPQDIMENCKSVVIIGTSLPLGCIQTLPKGRAEYTNTIMAATATLRITALHLAKEIEKNGYLATITPAEGSEFGYWYVDYNDMKGDISIKYACYLAGLGEYGINHLILTKDYNARVRFMAILTDAPLTYGSPSKNLIADKCKDCLKCVKICPSGAIHHDGEIDREKCRDYMFGRLGGLRCGLCVKACYL